MDESFNKNEFWVTGLIVPDSEAVALESALDAVVADAAASYGVSSGAELHGYELMSGIKDWLPVRGMFRARYGVFTDALEAIAKTPGIRAFSRGLDRVAHTRRYSNPHHPRQVLIGHVAQRCHSLLGQGEVLALFADDNPTKDGIRDHVRSFKKYGTWSLYNPHPLKNILDTVYFAPSCDSRLLQAADLVSYAQFRARTTPQASPSYQAAQDAWKIVEPMCDASLWKP